MKSVPRLNSIHWRRVTRWLAGGTGALALALLTGCSTVKFYSQAAAGQAQILLDSRPIPKVLLEPGVSERARKKLTLVQECRQFAKDKLQLPADWEYKRYTDLHRRYVVWVVYAAPEFSVEGKTWWYPMVGKLEYRGFFSEAAAKEEAARLKAEGWDVFMGGTEAYSTLGWFHDPVLNTFLYRSDSELVELIFHELTHVKLFLPGDTDFNEAFATANAEAGARQWLLYKGDTNGLIRYNKLLAREREMIRLLLATREELKELYAETSLPLAEMRRKKAAIIEGMRQEYVGIRQRWGENVRRDKSFSRPWTNARFNTVSTYFDLLPGFEGLLAESHGDLTAFYASVASMRSMTQAERRAILKEAARKAGERALDRASRPKNHDSMRRIE